MRVTSLILFMVLCFLITAFPVLAVDTLTWESNSIGLSTYVNGASVTSNDNLTMTGNHSYINITEQSGNGSSYISVDPVTFGVKNDTWELVEFTCDPNVTIGYYELTYNATSPEDADGDTILITCNITNEPDNNFSIAVVLSLIYISALFIVLYFKGDMDAEKTAERFFENPIKFLFFSIGLAFVYVILIVCSIIVDISNVSGLQNLMVILSTSVFYIFMFVGFVLLLKFVKVIIDLKDRRKKEGVSYG